MSNGAVIETSKCLIPLAKNKNAKVASSDETNINIAKSIGIEKVILSKKTKNIKKIKIDKTVDISSACAFNNVFFSTIILIPKNIADIIAKIGENIVLRRLSFINKDLDSHFYSYTHNILNKHLDYFSNLSPIGNWIQYHDNNFPLHH